MSDEHIFPQWMRELHPIDDKMTHVNRFDAVPERKRDVGTIKLKSVCQVCNGGWMGRIQKDVIPALKPIQVADEWEAIDGDGARSLHRWAVMTAMTYDAYFADKGIIPAVERLEYAENDRPSARWFSWLGRSAYLPGRGAGQHNINLIERPRGVAINVPTFLEAPTTLSPRQAMAFICGKPIVITSFGFRPSKAFFGHMQRTGFLCLNPMSTAPNPPPALEHDPLLDLPARLGRLLMEDEISQLGPR